MNQYRFIAGAASIFQSNGVVYEFGWELLAHANLSPASRVNPWSQTLLFEFRCCHCLYCSTCDSADQQVRIGCVHYFIRTLFGYLNELPRSSNRSSEA